MGVRELLRCVCLTVCLSVCLSVWLHISKMIRLNFMKFSVLTVAMTWFDDSALCYVLTVLWVMSCFYAMDHMACGVGNNDVASR